MMMRDKLTCGTFGKCPRVLCENQYTLPVGLSDELRMHRVRVYCPMCQEVYDPHADARGASDANDEIDGAFFGPSFPHIFLQTYPGLVPTDRPKCFQPKIFGFRVHNRKSIIQFKLDNGEYGDSLVSEEARRKRLTAGATTATTATTANNGATHQRAVAMDR
eukprot:Selendium_serpulae@DN5167_c1_g1_i1.p1